MATSVTEYREPRSIEEYLVGAMEKSSGCVEDEALIPPPPNCPATVDTLYTLSQTHILTFLVVIVFAIVMFQLIMLAMDPEGGGHH